MNNSHSDVAKRKRVYRCLATSVEGFVQQVAVSYIGNGYFFYVAGSLPVGHDGRATDEKIIREYGINVSKWVRARRKKKGLPNYQYIRFGRFFLILSTLADSRLSQVEVEVRDLRHTPIRFAGYSLSYRQGRDNTWHPSVRIAATEFRLIKRGFYRTATALTVEQVVARFWKLGFHLYAPIRGQYAELLRGVNKRRKLAGLEQVVWLTLPRQRRVLKPFG